MSKISVAILGGTGFGAGELLRLFSLHPAVEVVGVTSTSKAGSRYASVHPHLDKVYESSFVSSLEDINFEQYERSCVISALPHGESAKAIEQIASRYPLTKIIDLSGDLRLKDLDQHREYYSHSEDVEALRHEAVYGLTEIASDSIAQARIVSNPGCLATASILSLLPFKGKSIKSVHQHLATGSSGSGKEPKASTHHPIRHANFLAYKALEHQHVPEVIQCLQGEGVQIDDLPFVAHSLPISRGILCTTFLELDGVANQQDAENLIADFYRDKPFVRFKGSSPAEIENVVGSNFCDISVKVKDGHVVIHTTIDNLVKGMAGQAIHNLNVMFELPETTGLWFGAWRPV